MHPKYLSIKDFTYSLPQDKIADYPLPERDISKLLIYKEGKIAEDIYRNIAEYIPPDSLLVFNNTKVVEARLLFEKPTGGIIEIFCLEPSEQYADITTAMQQKEKVLWQCLVGGASKWKHGQILEKKSESAYTEIKLYAKYIGKKENSFLIELSWTPLEMSFAEILHYSGAIPLPPYIKREAEITDAERYQTIYARNEGSVAAPTAGLHFTDTVFKKFSEKNIQKDFVTLHVGAGTFKPVKTETMEQHDMHAEYIDVSKQTIINLLNNTDNNIIAVGTTSLRTIESLYWIGAKLLMNDKQLTIDLSQWEAYDLSNQNFSVKDCLEALINWMDKNQIEKLLGKTSLIIAPGYKTKVAKALITNFHQPQSTLLLLIASLIGNEWKKVYDYALKNNFRFLSYGDGCLFWIS